MKKHILLGILLAFTMTVYSQMDDKFYYPSRECQPIEGLNYEDIYQVAGGDTVHSIFIHPVGKPKATIMYCHGNGGNISTHVNGVRPLVGAGYQVLMIDYRGYGKSTGVPTHLNVVTDVQLVFDSLMHQEEVQDLPVLIYGASLGTQSATALAKNNQSKIAALVLDGAMASFTDLAVVMSPDNAKDMIRQYLKSPYSAKEDIKTLKNVRLLMIHSKEDQIPMVQAQEVYQNAVCPKTFWVYEGEHLQAPVLYPDLLVKYVDDLIK